MRTGDERIEISDRRGTVDDETSNFINGPRIHHQQPSQSQLMAHYIGLDVGTGSARACLIDEKGDILSVATKDIKTWHEKANYYVCLAGVKALICRNNRRRISGLRVVMLQNKLSRKRA
jgi:hypothetical protein